jgi:hypothetical protein
MPDSEGDCLARFRESGIFPNCGDSIPDGAAVIRGAGSFCSLDCVVWFFQAEFAERARRLASGSQN